MWLDLWTEKAIAFDSNEAKQTPTDSLPVTSRHHSPEWRPLTSLVVALAASYLCTLICKFTTISLSPGLSFSFPIVAQFLLRTVQVPATSSFQVDALSGIPAGRPSRCAFGLVPVGENSRPWEGNDVAEPSLFPGSDGKHCVRTFASNCFTQDF